MPIRAAIEPSLSAFEFFAGGGLAGLGLEAGGFRTTFANDFDAAKARAFRANHPDVPMHEGDVWGVAPASLPGRPDLCWASSPCQDLSLAGARRGLEGVRSGAFWGFWRLVQALDLEGRGPRAVVIENVAGLLSSNEGRDFAAVCAAMVQAGFRVGALEIDAALWLPQSRPRLFIVGVRGADAPERAAPGLPFHSERLVAVHAALPQTVRDAWAWWSLQPPARRNLDLAAVLEPDAPWLDAAATARLLNMTAPLHRARIEAATTAGAAFLRIRREHGVKQQRLEARFDGLAGCLRTPAGGSSRQFVVAPGPDGPRLRRLTAREAARLMGVGEDYQLPKSQSAGLKLMGDAVAVPVVRALAEQLLAPALSGARAAA